MRHYTSRVIGLAAIASVLGLTESFVFRPPLPAVPPACRRTTTTPASRTTALWMGRAGRYRRGTHGRSSPSAGGPDRTMRQERVGHLVKTEIANIIHSGVIKGGRYSHVEYLDDDLRKRINMIYADVSPDLRQCRLTFSVLTDRANPEEGVVETRRAHKWLVASRKVLRHTLAKRMSHMKRVPELTFHFADVNAAVDVMELIEKVNNGYVRERIPAVGEDDLTPGIYRGIDFADDEDDDDEWEDYDDGEDDDDDEDDFDIRKEMEDFDVDAFLAKHEPIDTSAEGEDEESDDVWGSKDIRDQDWNEVFKKP